MRSIENPVIWCSAACKHEEGGRCKALVIDVMKSGKRAICYQFEPREDFNWKERRKHLKSTSRWRVRHR